MGVQGDSINNGTLLALLITVSLCHAEVSGQARQKPWSAGCTDCGLGDHISRYGGPSVNPLHPASSWALVSPHTETLWFEPPCPIQTSHLSHFLSHQPLAGGALRFLC